MHGRLRLWRRLFPSHDALLERAPVCACTVQTDRWGAILHEKQAIVLPQYRKTAASSGIHCGLHTTLKYVDATVNMYLQYGGFISSGYVILCQGHWDFTFLRCCDFFYFYKSAFYNQVLGLLSQWNSNYIKHNQKYAGVNHLNLFACITVRQWFPSFRTNIYFVFLFIFFSF